MMHDSGVTHTVEIGTGNVLSGMVKRTVREISTQAIGQPEDIEKFASAA
jgi:malonyl CoA-acyl carrier protein transacylase